MAKKSRTYYCNTCQKSVTFQSGEVMKCNDCSALFGNNKRNPFEINMRTTWSGTTKVELTPVKGYVVSGTSLTFTTAPTNTVKYYVILRKYAPQTYSKVGQNDKYLKFPKTGVYT